MITKLTSKIFFTLVLALSACTETLAEGSDAEEIASLEIELIESLSVQEVWNLTSVNHVFSDTGVTIEVMQFSKEYYVRRDDFVPSYLVMAGMGDIDENPVAMKIWVQEDKYLFFDEKKSLQLSKEMSSGLAIFCFAEKHNKQILEDSNCVNISISDLGVVQFNGKTLGNIE